LKAKGEEVKAKNENQLMCALHAREKRTGLFKNSTTSSSNSPTFRKENQRFHNPTSEARDHALALFRVRPPHGKEDTSRPNAKGKVMKR